MYDGAAVDTIDKTIDLEQDSDKQQTEVEESENNTTSLELHSLINSDDKKSEHKQLIIIDSDVKDLNNLKDKFFGDLAVEVIMHDENGIDKISKILQKYPNLDSLHIV